MFVCFLFLNLILKLPLSGDFWISDVLLFSWWEIRGSWFCNKYLNLNISSNPMVSKCLRSVSIYAFFAHFLESNLNPHVSGQRREFCVFWYYAGEKSDNGQSLDIWRESSVSDGSYAMKTQFQEKVSQKSLNVIKTYFFCIRAIGPVLTWFSIRFFDDSLRRWIVCLFITNGFQSNRKSLIT